MYFKFYIIANGSINNCNSNKMSNWLVFISKKINDWSEQFEQFHHYPSEKDEEMDWMKVECNAI